MVFCVHGVIKSGSGSETLVWLTHNPMNNKTVGRPPEQTEVKSRLGVSNPAFIFAGADIETMMQTAFNPPVFTIKRKHVRSAKLICCQTGQEIFAFNLLFLFRFPFTEAQHFRRLGNVRKAGLGRGHDKTQ